MAQCPFVWLLVIVLGPGTVGPVLWSSGATTACRFCANAAVARPNVIAAAIRQGGLMG